MKKIVLIIIALLILAGGAFLWINRNTYFFQGQLELKEDHAKDAMDQDSQQAEDGSLPSQQEQSEQMIDNKPKITDYDCQQGCANRKSTENYDYCREICGLNGSEEYQKEGDGSDCASLEGLQKDICFKGKAIKEKNDSICNQISDTQMKKNCIDRVAEEFFE